MANDWNDIHDTPEAWVEAGLAHIQAGRDAEALEAFDRAVQRAPSHAGAYIGRGVALAKLNRN